MVTQNLDYAGGHGDNTRQRTDLGFRPQCACDAPTVPGVALDPFAGTATTGAVAIEEGRGFVGVELSERYCDLARQRLSGARRVLVAPAEPAPPVQEALFEELIDDGSLQ